MAPAVLRKNCTHCGKVFLTHQDDMEFCNSTCKHRHKYNDHFGFKQPKQVDVACAFCGDAVRIPNGGNEKRQRFCNNQCYRGYQKRQRDAESNVKEKKPNPGNPNKLPFEVIEKIEERRRVFDDKHAYWYTRRGGSYGG